LKLEIKHTVYTSQQGGLRNLNKVGRGLLRPSDKAPAVQAAGSQ